MKEEGKSDVGSRFLNQVQEALKLATHRAERGRVLGADDDARGPEERRGPN
jgi:hypothetical protein